MLEKDIFILKRKLWRAGQWLALGGLFFSAACAHSGKSGSVPATEPGAVSATEAAGRLVDRSNALVKELAAEDFKAVTAQFNEPLARALTAGTLEASWAALQREAGPLRRARSARVEPMPPHTRVTVDCQFKRSAVEIRIVWDGAGRVAGLFFEGANTLAKAPREEAAARDLINELAAGRFDAAEERFAPPLKAALPAPRLREAWSGLTAARGAFQGVESAQVERLLGRRVVRLSARFAQGPARITVIFDQAGEDGAPLISGLRLAPPES